MTDMVGAPTPNAPRPPHAPSPEFEPADRPAGAAASATPARLRDTWPLHKPQYVSLGAAYVVLTAVWVGIGLLITGPLDGSALTDWDQDAAEWFVDRRTPSLDTWTEYGSLLADTFVKIGVTAVVVVILLAAVHRWREPLVVAVSLILEASVFITVTVIVGRSRPRVPRLEDSPVDSSFPSGHVAAAVAYAAIAVVIFWHVRNAWVRAVTVLVVVAVPVAVGLSRAYRGMHFVSDVVFGALLGAASVWATWLVLRRPPEEREVAPAR